MTIIITLSCLLSSVVTSGPTLCLPVVGSRQNKFMQNETRSRNQHKKVFNIEGKASDSDTTKCHYHHYVRSVERCRQNKICSDKTVESIQNWFDNGSPTT